MSEHFPIVDGRLPTLLELLTKTKDHKNVLGQLFIPSNSSKSINKRQRERGYNHMEKPYYFDSSKALMLVDAINDGRKHKFELKFLDGTQVVEHEVDLQVSYRGFCDFYLLPGGIDESIKNKKICVTGATKIKRDIYRTILKNKGSFLANNVNRKTDMLVVADFNDKTSKLVKAEKLGIETITEKILTERLIGAATL